jgi:hypothetical protein
MSKKNKFHIFTTVLEQNNKLCFFKINSDLRNGDIYQSKNDIITPKQNLCPRRKCGKEKKKMWKDDFLVFFYVLVRKN